jgi:hypothetical protein
MLLSRAMAGVASMTAAITPADKSLNAVTEISLGCRELRRLAAATREWADGPGSVQKVACQCAFSIKSCFRFPSCFYRTAPLAPQCLHPRRLGSANREARTISRDVDAK